MKAMLMFLAAAAVAIFVAVAAFVLIAPERVWSLFGPADLGPVDFARLERRSSPNDALACPAGLCRAKIDVVPPVFAIDARRLRAAMAKALTSESRLALAHADDATLTDRYVQRSALLGFPDTIVAATSIILEIPARWRSIRVPSSDTAIWGSTKAASSVG